MLLNHYQILFVNILIQIILKYLAFSYHRRRESVYVTLLELLIGCRGWVKDVQPRLFHDTLCTALTEYPDSTHLLTIFIQSEV